MFGGPERIAMFIKAFNKPNSIFLNYLFLQKNEIIEISQVLTHIDEIEYEIT